MSDPAPGDPTLLHQMWANLLANALKFTADGTEPSIAIECERGDGETVYPSPTMGRGPT